MKTTAAAEQADRTGQGEVVIFSFSRSEKDVKKGAAIVVRTTFPAPKTPSPQRHIYLHQTRWPPLPLCAPSRLSMAASTRSATWPWPTSGEFPRPRLLFGFFFLSFRAVGGAGLIARGPPPPDFLFPRRRGNRASVSVDAVGLCLRWWSDVIERITSSHADVFTACSLAVRALSKRRRQTQKNTVFRHFFSLRFPPCSAVVGRRNSFLWSGKNQGGNGDFGTFPIWALFARSFLPRSWA